MLTTTHHLTSKIPSYSAISVCHFASAFLPDSSSILLPFPTIFNFHLSLTFNNSILASYHIKSWVGFNFVTWFIWIGGYMKFYFSLFLCWYTGCRWWFMVGLAWNFGLGLKLEWKTRGESQNLFGLETLRQPMRWSIQLCL